MNDIAGIHHYHETNQISQDDAIDAQICARLAEARGLADAGEWIAARTLCAELIILHQPLLARDPRRLSAILATLAVARGFRAIARLLAATSNRTVRFNVVPQRGTTLATGIQDVDGTEHVTISEPWLGDRAAVRAWSERLGYGHLGGAHAPHDHSANDHAADEHWADYRPGCLGARPGFDWALSP